VAAQLVASRALLSSSESVSYALPDIKCCIVGVIVVVVNFRKREVNYPCNSPWRPTGV
jgi:hypothetical protein